MRWAWVMGGGVAALMILNACDVQREPPPLAGAPMSGAVRACPRIYNPVCASRFGERRTFPNACEARASGYRIGESGQCDAGGGSGGSGQPGGGFGQPGGDGGGQGGGQACAAIYQPVCARRGHDTRTFPNSCRAESGGYDVIYQSECRGSAQSQGGPSSGGNGGQFGNDNERRNDSGRGDNGGFGGSSGGNSDFDATGGGSSVIDRSGDGGAAAGAGRDSASSGGGESCGRSFVPVCGAKNGEKKTFINACMAKSKGYSVSGEGRCQ